MAPAPDTAPQGADDPDAPHLNRRPAALLVLVAGVGLEVVALVGAAVYLVVRLFTVAEVSLGLSVSLVLLALGVAVALVAASRALLRGRRGGRAPVATWQLLQAIVGATAMQSGATAWGAPLVAVAVVVLVCLVRRSVVEFTTGSRPPAEGSR
ncbi:hypothetical protein GCM10025865_21240 [Paraoerskovia sediminicola]|uniref:Histidine kinase n=1 Tax=Paraoerskovia sediminicola TaxID=1138587 RepID=A0ABN6XG97_9CELL|nr:hypothetical protein [Paraoerskovia sediminicola]BDZ42825.1 hypothetical protein GCM10025865_21240 [Paraoerskovia sediminicola]